MSRKALKWAACTLLLLTMVAALAGVAWWTAVPDGHGTDRRAQSFQDCEGCPRMLRVPAGVFGMGPEPGKRAMVLEALGLAASSKRQVTIGKPFAIGMYEVTFDDWQVCVDDSGCGGHRPHDEGWGRGSRPVIHVSWNDAQSYVRWLSQKTGLPYRLPSDAEWEHAARARTDTAYPWGRRASHAWANYGGPDCPPCLGVVSDRDQWLHTAPAGSFPPNGHGLYDMNGNVYEWVADCHDAQPKPTDGSAAIAEHCSSHTLRGGAWYSDPARITSSYRAWQAPDRRDRVVGFRVARSL